MNFANIRNNEILDMNSKYLDTDIIRVEVSDEIYQAYVEDRNKVVYQDGEIVLNPNYETEQEIKERERIAHLSLTRGDVFRGLLMARGVTRLMLRGMIEANEQLTEVQKEMALIDFDEALNFYRGNALIDTVGLALGIEPSQLDCFFETNDYTCLLPTKEPEEAEDDSISTDISE